MRSEIHDSGHAFFVTCTITDDIYKFNDKMQGKCSCIR